MKRIEVDAFFMFLTTLYMFDNIYMLNIED